MRCGWCQDEGIMQAYHDQYWGIPLHDDKGQFGFLMMEVMQCGLSWLLMLRKREIFMACFDGFDYRKIAAYDDQDIQRIMETPGMIKSIRKIKAVISNAQAFIKIIQEFGSFDAYLWAYTQGETLVYQSHQHEPVARNELSDEISKDLRKRGFKYLGSITVYSHLQACGVINDHEQRCFMYEDIISRYPIRYIE